MYVHSKTYVKFTDEKYLWKDGKGVTRYYDIATRTLQRQMNPSVIVC